MEKLPRLIYEMLRVAYRTGFCEASHMGKPVFHFGVGPVTSKKSTVMPLEITLTTDQQVLVHLNPVTPKGKPAPLDGIATWSVQTGDVTLQPAVDGLSCTIVSSDTASESSVLVSADADLGAGVVTISDTIAVSVVSTQATSLGLVADAPTAKP